MSTVVPVNTMNSHIRHLQERLAKAERERDEARQLLEALRRDEEIARRIEALIGAGMLPGDATPPAARSPAGAASPG